MFGFKRRQTEEKQAVSELKDELRKSRQEREAARLGLMSAVARLMREAQSIPLDSQVEVVAKDLAAVGRNEDVRS